MKTILGNDSTALASEHGGWLPQPRERHPQPGSCAASAATAVNSLCH
jgi:hypothetical protein